MKNIGIIGVRGYGVIYSGFEIFIKHLVNKSKNVYYYIFCRGLYQTRHIRKQNFETVIAPSVGGKYLETVFYSFFSDVIGIAKSIRVVVYLGLSNTPFIFIQKLLRRKIIVNVDGLDWQRKRWNIFGKIYLKMCERLAFIFTDVIVCDSKTVFAYYQKKYQSKKLVYIPYGIDSKITKPGRTLVGFNLVPQKYIHLVGRLTPENCVEDLIIAFKKVKTDFKCVIVGDSVYEDKYKQYLIDLARDDDRIIFTGFLKGKEYKELCSNSALYIETKEIGGTHPSLLDAIGFENPIVAKNINYHKEVLEKNGIYYNNRDDLTKKINMILKNIVEYRGSAKKTKNTLLKRYSWNNVVKQYEDIFQNLIN